METKKQSELIFHAIEKSAADAPSMSKGRNMNTASQPPVTVVKEKYEKELCAHYLWDNGLQSVFLCPKAGASGVIMTTLENAVKLRPELAAMARDFDAENVANEMGKTILPAVEDTLVLYLPRRMCQKREYLIDVILSEPEKTAGLKILIHADDDASGVVTVNMRSREGNADNFAAVMLYCHVGRNAHLVLNEVQDFSLGTGSVMRKQTIVEEGGEIRWNVCELGGKESLSDLNLRMVGKDSSAVVYGLYFPTGTQKMKLLTRQDHTVPRTYSNLHYKGAISGQATAHWEGMVYVDPKAEKADGYQKNENLILSKDAHVYSKPGLEIITDDVKCSHGTTITNIDDNQIFYLTSRGIPKKEAESLVIQGYFDTVLNLITFTPIRSKLQEKISAKLG